MKPMLTLTVGQPTHSCPIHGLLVLPPYRLFVEFLRHAVLFSSFEFAANLMPWRWQMKKKPLKAQNG